MLEKRQVEERMREKERKGEGVGEGEGRGRGGWSRRGGCETERETCPTTGIESRRHVTCATCCECEWCVSNYLKDAVRHHEHLVRPAEKRTHV